MNDKETRKLILEAFAAANASDHDALMACLSEDVVHEGTGMPREIGKEKLRWRLAELMRHFRAEATDIAVMTAPGGLRAAAEFTLSGSYLAAQEAREKNVQLSAGVFLEIDDDGLISRLTFCYDPERLRASVQDDDKARK